MLIYAYVVVFLCAGIGQSIDTFSVYRSDTGDSFTWPGIQDCGSYNGYQQPGGPEVAPWNCHCLYSYTFTSLTGKCEKFSSDDRTLYNDGGQYQFYRDISIRSNSTNTPVSTMYRKCAHDTVTVCHLLSVEDNKRLPVTFGSGYQQLTQDCKVTSFKVIHDCAARDAKPALGIAYLERDDNITYLKFFSTHNVNSILGLCGALFQVNINCDDFGTGTLYFKYKGRTNLIESIFNNSIPAYDPVQHPNSSDCPALKNSRSHSSITLLISTTVGGTISVVILILIMITLILLFRKRRERNHQLQQAAIGEHNPLVESAVHRPGYGVGIGEEEESLGGSIQMEVSIAHPLSEQSTSVEVTTRFSTTTSSN